MQCEWLNAYNAPCGRETNRMLRRPTYDEPDEMVDAFYCDTHFERAKHLTGGTEITPTREKPADARE